MEMTALCWCHKLPRNSYRQQNTRKERTDYENIFSRFFFTLSLSSITKTRFHNTFAEVSADGSARVIAGSWNV